MSYLPLKLNTRIHDALPQLRLCCGTLCLTPDIFSGGKTKIKWLSLVLRQTKAIAVDTDQCTIG